MNDALQEENQMKIRSVKESDIDTIGTIYERAFEHSKGVIKYYQGFPEYVKFCMKQGYAFVLEEGTVCGVILGYEKPDMFMGKVAYIELLAVLPECQGKGYGKNLIQKFEEFAVQKKIKQLSLRTGCYMKAFHIYHHLGFIDTRDDQRYMIRHIQNETV